MLDPLPKLMAYFSEVTLAADLKQVRKKSLLHVETKAVQFYQATDSNTIFFRSS